MDVLISDHAKFEAARREMPLELILYTAQSPQQEISTSDDRIICQSKIFDPVAGKELLYRIIVEDTGSLRKVITGDL